MKVEPRRRLTVRYVKPSFSQSKRGEKGNSSGGWSSYFSRMCHEWTCRKWFPGGKVHPGGVTNVKWIFNVVLQQTMLAVRAHGRVQRAIYDDELVHVCEKLKQIYQNAEMSETVLSACQDLTLFTKAARSDNPSGYGSKPRIVWSLGQPFWPWSPRDCRLPVWSLERPRVVGTGLQWSGGREIKLS